MQNIFQERVNSRRRWGLAALIFGVLHILVLARCFGLQLSSYWKYQFADGSSKYQLARGYQNYSSLLGILSVLFGVIALVAIVGFYLKSYGLAMDMGKDGLLGFLFLLGAVAVVAFFIIVYNVGPGNQGGGGGYRCERNCDSSDQVNDSYNNPDPDVEQFIDDVQSDRDSRTGG
jgi:hypothetical protein